MRNKSLFLLLAGICGTVAAVGVGQWMKAQDGSATVAMSEILVTTVSINAEEEITADKLRLEQWPSDRIPQGASPDLSLFEGRFAKVPIFAGEPIFDQKLMNEVEDKVVPQGYTVVSLPADRDGTINLVSPGDRVDIRGFFTEGEMFARDMALDVLTGVKVYGIDGITKFDPDKPRARSARNIQLLIRKADVEALDFAKKYGEISLSLGSPSPDDETIAIDEPSESAQKFIRDLRERREEREEQERLRLLAEQETVEEPKEIKEAPKKATFRTTKMVNGRLIVYEWVEGESVPRVVADTGALDLATTDKPNEPAQLNTPKPDDYPRGSDSPFFETTQEDGE